jgi:hypothetical protein
VISSHPTKIKLFFRAYIHLFFIYISVGFSRQSLTTELHKKFVEGQAFVCSKEVYIRRHKSLSYLNQIIFSPESAIFLHFLCYGNHQQHPHYHYHHLYLRLSVIRITITVTQIWPTYFSIKVNLIKMSISETWLNSLKESGSSCNCS